MGQAKKSGITYQSWRSMVARCESTDPKKSKYYADSGIDVCSEWIASFDQFLSDVGERPSKLYTIERIENKIGYKPGNVRWATQKEQSRNKRNNVYYEYQGEKKILSDWCEKFSIPEGMARARLRLGWNISEIIETPKGVRLRFGRCRLLEIDGETKTMAEWSAKSGIAIGTIWNRLKLGWPSKDAVFVPLVKKRAGIKRGQKLYTPAGPPPAQLEEGSNDEKN